MFVFFCFALLIVRLADARMYNILTVMQSRSTGMSSCVIVSKVCQCSIISGVTSKVVLPNEMVGLSESGLLLVVKCGGSRNLLTLSSATLVDNMGGGFGRYRMMEMSKSSYVYDSSL